jgi:hypothetical protein
LNGVPVTSSIIWCRISIPRPVCWSNRLERDDRPSPHSCFPLSWRRTLSPTKLVNLMIVQTMSHVLEIISMIAAWSLAFSPKLPIYVVQEGYALRSFPLQPSAFLTFTLPFSPFTLHE